MNYQTFAFIMDNKHRLLYDDAATTGNDNTTDATATTVNPNNFLAPLAGGKGVKGFLVLVIMVLVIIFLIKKIM